MESLTSGLVLTTPLQSHLHAQPWSEPAQAIVARHPATRHTTLVAYAPRFDAAIALHARSMILVMVASAEAIASAAPVWETSATRGL